MEQAILLYASVKKVDKLITYGAGLVAGLLALRLANDLHNAYEDPEIEFKAAIKKGKKRIYASIIGITASGLISWIASYYK